MDMPLKPNVLEDMARSVSISFHFAFLTVQNWIAPPAPRAKFYSAQDAIHLEDESGRVRLVGAKIRDERERDGGGIVTGVIMSALGFETGNGDFEVVDICFAGLPDVYRPTAGPSGGKAKGKAVEDAMDVDEGE
jgi:DNA polymerase delta subunit 2